MNSNPEMDTRYSAPELLPLPHPVHHHHHLFPCPQHNSYHHHHHHVIICPRHHKLLFPPRLHGPCVDTYGEVHTLPPLQNHLSSETNPCHQPFPPSTQTSPDEEHLGLEEEEEEDEPVFVLTDEWRDFFAKSEAKRKLEKQQAKKKGRK